MAADTRPWHKHFKILQRSTASEAVSEAFRGYRDVLMTAVTEFAILPLANSLYSHGIISGADLSHAEMTTLIPAERKVHLFDAIEAGIRSKPKRFCTLLDILDAELVFRDHAMKLWEAYENEADSLIIREYLIQFIRLHPTTDPFEEINKETFDSKSDDEEVTADEEVIADEEMIADEEISEDEKKQGLFSGMRRGIRKLFGAARDMTATFIKNTLSILKLDIKICRKYKKRFDKHSNREQVRWWFEIWGDEHALNALESKWDEVSAKTKWRLETCPALPQLC